MAATAGLSLFFGHFNANIATQSVTVLGKLPPPSKAGVLNILALGSQTRDGQGPGDRPVGHGDAHPPERQPHPGHRAVDSA
jgi:hypothetical protein